ncbi:MAG: chloride channel protein [Nitrospiria bacterium]
MDVRVKNAFLRMGRSGKALFDLLTFSQERTLSILVVVVGLTAGISAYIFKRLIDGVHHLCCGSELSSLIFSGNWYRVFLPAIGGLLTGLVIYNFALDAGGHGISRVIYALKRLGGRIRPRVAVAKSITSAFTIGTGGSAGPEGPIIQIGASVGSTFGQWFHLPTHYMKTLVAAGAAGGFSAVFNAPIAAVIFSMEILLGDFSSQAFSMVVISSVIASVTSHILLGDEIFLPTPAFGIEHQGELGLYFFLGILSVPLARLFIHAQFFTEGLFKRFKQIPKPIRPMIGGLMVGSFGLFVPMILGSGHHEIMSVVSTGDDSVRWTFSFLLLLAFGKMVSTSVTLGSGGSGGTLTPCLFIGATMGTLFGNLARIVFPNIASSGAYALVGMGTFFAAVVHAPFTAIIMMFEITHDYRIVVPLMFSVTIAMLMSRQIGAIGMDAMVLLKKGVRPESGATHDPLKDVTAGEVMARDVDTVHENMTMEKLSQFMEHSPHTGFPVLNAEGALSGMIIYADVHHAIDDGLDPREIPVRQIMQKLIPTAFTEEDLGTVVRRMQEFDVDRIAIVDPDNTKRLIGLITRTNIISAYQPTMKH